MTDSIDPGAEFSHKLSYAYDGRGVRVVRAESPSDGAGTVARRSYVYSPELQLLSVTREDGPNVWGGNPPSPEANNIDYEIVWFAGRPVAQISPGGASRYTFTDHLGTPLLQTDNTATIRWRVEYEPFGNIYEVREGTRTDQPLRFPGQELAMTWEGPEESYNIHRWYKSAWGRYTQADPIGFESGDTNWYAYSGDNPIGFVDPLGLERLTTYTPAPNIPFNSLTPYGIYRDFRDRRRRAQDIWRGQGRMRHCTFSCEMSLEYGDWITRAAGFANEGQGFFMHDLMRLRSRLSGQTAWAFHLQDLEDNEIGFGCADRVRRNRQCTSCIQCCHENIFGNHGASGGW